MQGLLELSIPVRSCSFTRRRKCRAKFLHRNADSNFSRDRKYVYPWKLFTNLYISTFSSFRAPSLEPFRIEVVNGVELLLLQQDVDNVSSAVRRHAQQDPFGSGLIAVRNREYLLGQHLALHVSDEVGTEAFPGLDELRLEFGPKARGINE